MTKTYWLRQETKEDLKGIFEVSELAFRRDDEARLVDALRNNPTAFVPNFQLLQQKKIKSSGISCLLNSR